MSTQRQLNDGERIAGTPYRVIRLIGLGGMGCVYEVEHEELGKRFVLKALLRELASREDLVQRMRTEWRALGRLEHPNIVRVSDAGLANGKLPYYVMELLRGAPLSEVLKRRGRLPLEEALGIAIAVLDGLGAAHEIGVVHRDVKPPNIFLCTDGVPRLLDFGIAKLLDTGAESITARGVAVGTPRYMSPEQAAGNPVDARADLYAVGLVLFEMIAGVGPYKAADANELFLAHLTQQAALISSRVKGVSPQLDALVASLLAKAPSDRPISAAAAARGLRAELRAARSSVAKPPHESTDLAPRVTSDSSAASQSELLTLIGDVQQVLDCQTRHANPPPGSKKPPPLPKASALRQAEVFAEAPPHRTSEHTLFLNELPLPSSDDAAESTLTSVAAEDYPSNQALASGGSLSRASLRRWLFPIGVVGAAAVALLLTLRPKVETDALQVIPAALVEPQASPVLAARDEAAPLVPPANSVSSPDAGHLVSNAQGSGPSSLLAPVQLPLAVPLAARSGARVPHKLPNPKLFSSGPERKPAIKPPVLAENAPSKASLLPPSGL